ncbi:MAG: PIN domain-containing protein [Verrucomicrobiota bacterium]
MTTRYLVDTNILLRFLSGEPPRQAAAARRLFAGAAAGEVVLDVSPVIVAETIYTLVSFYGVERKKSVEKLLLLLRQPGLKIRDSTQVFSALERLLTANVGFADAFLAAGGAEENVPVASFDRDLDKFRDIKRFEPTA